MPFANEGAARMLFDADDVASTVSLHTTAVPTIADELSSAPGYARQDVAAASRWRASTSGETPGLLNDEAIRFRASGGDWPTFRSVALRDGSGGGAQISAYATLATPVALHDGDEWTIDDGDVVLALTRAAPSAAGFAGSDAEMEALLDGAAAKGLANTVTLLRMHSAYPTAHNVIAGYPEQQLTGSGAGDGQWAIAGSVVSNGGSIRYAAAGVERAAPAWWSLSLNTAGKPILLAGQVSGTQGAIPAGQAFRIAPGQIAITVADA